MQLESWEDAVKKAKARAHEDAPDLVLVPVPSSAPPMVKPARWSLPWKVVALFVVAMTAIVSSVLTAGLFKLMDRREPGPLSPASVQETTRSIEVPAAPLTPVADYTRWELVRTLEWNNGNTRCVAFSPDGQTLAVGGGRYLEGVLSADGYPGSAETGLVQLWDVKTWSAKLQIAEPMDQSIAIVFYPEGLTIAVGDRRKTKIVDTRTGALKFSIPATAMIGSLSILKKTSWRPTRTYFGTRLPVRVNHVS